MAEAIPVEPVDQSKSEPLNPIVRQILIGIHDENSSLFRLQTLRHVVKQVWSMVKEEWAKCIETYTSLSDDGMMISANNHGLNYDPEQEIVQGGMMQAEEIEFPKFTGININMMPFKMSLDFAETKLPESVLPYYDKIIRDCFYLDEDNEELDKIGFLTIHESEVIPNVSQRRPGIHTEKGRRIYLSQDEHLVPEHIGSTDSRYISRYILWGMGDIMRRYKEIHGGIYMATNVPNSSRVWNCRILDHPDGDEIIGNLGDITHLRSLLPESTVLDANHLYWMTDRTPHESLPLVEGGKRQFFRLVTHKVSVWYEEHSTPNPYGLQPDPEITRIVKGSKFQK